MSDWLANAVREVLKDRDIRTSIIKYLTPVTKPEWEEKWWQASEARYCAYSDVYTGVDTQHEVVAVIYVEFCKTRNIYHIEAAIVPTRTVEYRQEIYMIGDRQEKVHWPLKSGQWQDEFKKFHLWEETGLEHDYAKAITRGQEVWPEILKEFRARTEEITE